MNKTIFITGSSSGIGRATVLYFQRRGWNIAASMRSPEKETELNNLPNVICPKVDVTDSETVRQAIKDTIQKFGRIDVILNNAGYSLSGVFESSTEEQIQDQFATNVFGTMNVIREVLPYFREKKNGIIINISSMGGKFGIPLYSAYSSTKFAIEGYTESLHYELSPLGIKVKLIEPGPIKTDFYGRSGKVTKSDELAEYKNISKRLSNLNKHVVNGVDPEKVAGTIWQAANSATSRLRYIPDFNGRVLIQLRKLLPDWIFINILRRIIN